MTDTMSSSAADAGRLISYGIQAAKFRPTRDTDYRDLVLRFLADRDFERLVVAIAGGQGLSIVACDRVEGLIFAPTPESIYGIRLADYIGVESAEIRLLHGIVQLGIAVTAYPTANALEDATHISSVSATQVYDRLMHLAEECRRRAGRDDPPEDDPEAERIWHLLLRLRPTDTTPDERDTPYNVMGAIRKALRWLTDAWFGRRGPRNFRHLEAARALPPRCSCGFGRGVRGTAGARSTIASRGREHDQRRGRVLMYRLARIRCTGIGPADAAIRSTFARARTF